MKIFNIYIAFFLFSIILFPIVLISDNGFYISALFSTICISLGLSLSEYIKNKSSFKVTRRYTQELIIFLSVGIILSFLVSILLKESKFKFYFISFILIFLWILFAIRNIWKIFGGNKT